MCTIAPDHLLALVHRVDAQHCGIRGQRTRTNPEHRAPAADVIELNDALGNREGMVIGDRYDSGTEPYAMGMLSRRSQKQLG